MNYHFHAGVNFSVKAHGSWRTCSSKARGIGVFVENTLKRGCWNSESAFTSFYCNDIIKIQTI